jgi:DNA-binding CsgD family transcriptional regulator
MAFPTEDGAVSLPARDFRKIVDLVIAVLDSRDTSAAWENVVEHVVEVLPGEVGWMYENIDLQRSTGRLCARSLTASGPPLDSWLGKYMSGHPLARHLAATGDPTPVSVHDVVSDRTWRNNPAWSDLYTAFGMTRQMVLAVPAAPAWPGAPPTWRTCLIGRSGSDFTAGNRRFAAHLQPVLVRLDRHLAELNRLRAMSAAASPPEQRAADVGLTPRELTVLALLAEGLTASALARQLGITRRTALKHLENIYRKWGTSDRLTTVLLARETGILPTPILPSYFNTDIS